MPENFSMPAKERQAVMSLASIFAFRMLGLFMVLPVFSLYVNRLKGATPTSIGFALGIYGLAQALLQIPLGMLSDKIGRKIVIIIGLSIFIFGSVLAAISTTIDGMIIGRALQGAGAIGSTIIALVADLTTVENRTQSMAIIGMTIGLSFMLAMLLGPIVNVWIGLRGIFWVTAVLGLFGIIILYIFVPHPPQLIFHRDTEPVPALFKAVLKNAELLRLNLGIMFLHATLTAIFIAIPIVLDNMLGLNETHQWYLFLPVLILAFIFMFPLIMIAEKGRKIKSVFLICITALFISLLGLWHFHKTTFNVAMLLFIFFTAFTVLEAIIPSVISKLAPATSKGTAIGIYSTSQFFGIFLGGVIGGWMFSSLGSLSIFLFAAVMCALWLCIAFPMKAPPHLATYMLPIGQISENQARKLTQLLMNAKGVSEAAIIVEEGIAYLKVDNKMVDRAQLQRIVRERITE